MTARKTEVEKEKTITDVCGGKGFGHAGKLISRERE